MKFKEKKTCTKDKGNYAYKIISFSVLVLYALSILLLFYLALVSSFKSRFEYNEINLLYKGFFDIPKDFTFENFATAFNGLSLNPSKKPGGEIYLPQMLLYSLVFTVTCSFAMTAVPCLVAYLVSKYNVWLNKVIYTLVVIALSLPIVGGLPSEIMIAKALGIYNTLFGIWIMKASFLGMYFLVFYGTFQGLSNEYMEAAKIDGAGHVAILFRIVIPLIKNTFFAVFILVFISYWNDYQTPFVYMKNYPTLSVAIFMFDPQNQGGTPAHIVERMAACVILFLPVFVIFIVFKKAFMGNLTVGGIKG